MKEGEDKSLMVASVSNRAGFDFKPDISGLSRDVIRRFCRNGNGHLFYRGKKTFRLWKQKSDNPRKLTEEQKYAVEYIIGAVNEERYKGILLYGVTGSGKTEVYLRAAESAIAAGGTVLLEVPEIALTNQMVSYFADYFGDKVVLCTVI